MSTENQTIEVLKSIGMIYLPVTVIVLALVQFLIAIWLKTRIQYSIKNEYDERLEKYKLFLKYDFDQKLEEYKYDIKVREQAAKIAELFSEARYVSDNLTTDSAKKLNRLTWELSLWLPPDLVREITKNLCFKANGKDVKVLLVDIRKHILKSPDDPLEPSDITHFELK